MVFSSLFRLSNPKGIRPQKSHKERLIRKNSREDNLFIHIAKTLTKNLSSVCRLTERLYKNTGMSAAIPFNYSNNHTTDHFGREDAIVRREICISAPRCRLFGVQTCKYNMRLLRSWGYLSKDTKTYRWIKRFVLPVCRLNTNTISL
ncbi:ISPg4 transposase [Porphyromonas gingivalis]|nr:ISPg4 transposase [Porphyromonas gingivalis]